jgi:single-strand DNA-binding protein
MAESAEKLLKKGTQIYIEGKLQTRQWIDKDNIKRNITEIVGESFLVLQRKDNNTNQNLPEDSSNVNFDDLGKKDILPF